MGRRRHLPSVEGLNQNDAAKIAGIHVDTFRKMKERDLPPPKNANGFYELDPLGDWIRNRARAEVAPNDSRGPLVPAQERARKDREMADRYELENRLRRGELIEVTVVQEAALEVVSRVRTRLLRLPSAVTPLILGEEDRIAIQSTIDSAVRDALMELSGNWTDTAGGNKGG